MLYIGLMDPYWMIAAALDETSWFCFAAFVSVFNRGSLEKQRSWSNYSSAFTALILTSPPSSPKSRRGELCKTPFLLLFFSIRLASRRDLLSGRLADRLPALAAHCQRSKSPLNFSRVAGGGGRGRDEAEGMGGVDSAGHQSANRQKQRDRRV